MTTRAEIRARVRDELNDNGAVKLWSDGLLNRWIGEAIRDWSQVAPRDRVWQTTSTANNPSYLLPSDVLEVVRVQHPPGLFRVRGGLHDGDAERLARSATGRAGLGAVGQRGDPGAGAGRDRRGDRGPLQGRLQRAVG